MFLFFQNYFEEAEYSNFASRRGATGFLKHIFWYLSWAF